MGIGVEYSQSLNGDMGDIRKKCRNQNISLHVICVIVLQVSEAKPLPGNAFVTYFGFRQNGFKLLSFYSGGAGQIQKMLLEIV